jgi:excisionase family DNA binding protein
VDETRDSLDRLTTAEAASRLGISEAGVRKRVQRGQIPHQRDETGRLWVYVDTRETPGQGSRDGDTESRDGPAPHAGDALMAQMQARIDSLERQLAQANERDRENRRIIAALTQRIPELPPPAQEEVSSEPRAAHESTASEQDRAEPRPAGGGAMAEDPQRPWWRRWFGE